MASSTVAAAMPWRGVRIGGCTATCHLCAAGNDLRTKKAYDASLRELDDAVVLHDAGTAGISTVEG